MDAVRSSDLAQVARVLRHHIVDSAALLGVGAQPKR
jgi:hypothetical protein